jgi:hypothetical protein
MKPDTRAQTVQDCEGRRFLKEALLSFVITSPQASDAVSRSSRGANLSKSDGLFMKPILIFVQCGSSKNADARHPGG